MLVVGDIMVKEGGGKGEWTCSIKRADICFVLIIAT